MMPPPPRCSVIMWLWCLVFTISATTCGSFIISSDRIGTKRSRFCRQQPQLYISAPNPLFVSGRPASTTTTTTTASKKSQNRPEYNVMYQKVVRPTSALPDLLFLGYLVEYLQDVFQLPSNLPMVYQKHLPPDDANDNNNNNNNNNNGADADRSILWWDSPMATSPELTRLSVEVIGIYADNDVDESSAKDPNKSAKPRKAPSMAMVVVRQQKSTSNSNKQIPAMMKNLFQDSEKRIVRALDRGLDDLMAGNAKVGEVSPTAAAKQLQQQKQMLSPNVRTAEEALKAEWMAEGRQQLPDQEKNDNEVVNTNAAAVDIDKHQLPKAGKQKANTFANNSTIQSDYAVRAAQRVAVMKTLRPPQSMTTDNLQPPAKEDFAVQAARQRAAKRRHQGAPPNVVTAATPKTQGKINELQQHPNASTSSPSSTSVLPQQEAIGLRATRTMNKRKIEDNPMEISLQASKSHREDSVILDANFTVSSSPQSTKKSKKAKSATASDKDDAVIPTPTTKRRLNVIYQNEEMSDPTTDQDDFPKPNAFFAANTATNHPPGGEQLAAAAASKNSTSIQDHQRELDIFESSRQALQEMAEQGQDMSAEELLADVLKYGDQQDRENAAGSGFVSGAFEKAKELLRERSKQREVRLQSNSINNNVGEASQTVSPFQIDIRNDGYDNNNNNNKQDMSPEEELKQMFEAGERLAYGKISMANPASDAELVEPRRETQPDDIDDLIAADKTVSQHARVLDDDLTELAVCINKSPGEELDGPRRNPTFDIFSGPEVYNLNVDPETSVNWPGALPGTKNLRLPRELNEAVKQASFAANVLSKLTETSEKNEPGEPTATRFWIGEKEVSSQQVDGLLSVVNEAVQIGLIADPLELMAERSRLEMIVKELWDQPGERFREIASNYKGLLLSDNFVALIRERLANMADRDLDALRRNDDSMLEDSHNKRERDILGHLVVYAQLLLKEARALGAELEAHQLEVIRSICKVAMDPSHATEEETAVALSDAVRDMRPLFDDSFVAYLKYAVAEEEGRLARAGVVDDANHNEWLFVLKIVQQGVYREIARGINRYIEHIWYVLRMETKTERRMLLKKLIDVMPTMDVRPFVQVVDSIVASLGDISRGEFDGHVALGELTNKLLQLYRDVHELLPPDRINRMSRDADDWAAKQRQRLVEQQKLTKQRLTAARETEHLDGEIEALGRKGEVERMT